MKVKTSYEKCEYITAGKTYNADIYDEITAVIKDDMGDTLFIRLDYKCLHLDGKGSWEIVEE